MWLWLYTWLLDADAAFRLHRRFPQVQVWACYRCAKTIRRFNQKCAAARVEIAEIRTDGDYIINMEAK